MNFNKVYLSLIPVFLFSNASFASSIDARTNSMGGTGVASSSYIAASFNNPALLASQSSSDDFGLLFPAISLRGSDENELVSKVSDFQDLNHDLFDGIITGSSELSEEQVQSWKNELSGIKGGQVLVSASTGFALTLPTDVISASIFMKTDLDAVSNVNLDLSDLDIDKYNPNVGLDKSNVDLTVGAVSDFGLSFAKSFDLSSERKLMLGISPKVQGLAVSSYDDSLDRFDASDFDSEQDVYKKIAFNVDVGAAFKPSDSVTVGLVGKNLISQKLKAKTVNDKDVTLELTPSVKAGISYAYRGVTVAADVDLNSYKTLVLGEQKYFGVGIEYDFNKWAQIRGGYKLDVINDDRDPTVSLGLGLKPFGKFGIDLAAQRSGERDYTASIQFVMTL